MWHEADGDGQGGGAFTSAMFRWRLLEHSVYPAVQQRLRVVVRENNG